MLKAIICRLAFVRLNCGGKIINSRPRRLLELSEKVGESLNKVILSII